MGEQMRVNTICPECDGRGEVQVARAIAAMRPGPGANFGPAGTTWVTEPCKTCGGDGKLKGFQAPV